MHSVAMAIAMRTNMATTMDMAMAIIMSMTMVVAMATTMAKAHGRDHANGHGPLISCINTSTTYVYECVLWPGDTEFDPQACGARPSFKVWQ